MATARQPEPDSYDGLKDGHDGYLLARKMQREALLKAGKAVPVNDEERALLAGVK